MSKSLFYVGTAASFAYHHHDGVVAGYGAYDFMQAGVVNVVCQTACVSRTCLDNGYVGRKFYPVFRSKSEAVCGSVIRLYMVLLGNTYT